jgi:hypothetical protein
MKKMSTINTQIIGFKLDFIEILGISVTLFQQHINFSIIVVLLKIILNNI